MWQNPRWNSPEIGSDLRQVFLSLEQFLRQPTFYSGFRVGAEGEDLDGIGRADPVTGIPRIPNTILVNADSLGGDPDDTDPPPTMGGPVLIAGFQIVYAAWTASTAPDVANNNGYYRVQLSTDSSFATVLRSVDTPATSTVFSGLTTGTTYWVRVAAIDTSGNVGGFSGASNATAGQIGSGSLGTNSVGASNISPGSILGDVHVVPGTIVTDNLAAGAITADKIAANTIHAGLINSLEIINGKYIRSASYLPGQFGWAINGAGDCEFNQVTLRGNLYAQNIYTPNGTSAIGMGPSTMSIAASVNFVCFAGANFQGSIVASQGVFSSGDVVVGAECKFVRSGFKQLALLSIFDGGPSDLVLNDAIESVSSFFAKENVVKVDGWMDVLGDAPSYEWTYRKDIEASGRRRVGPLVEQLPDVVVFHHEGGDDLPYEKQRGLSTGNMLGALWGAAHEMVMKIRALEKRVVQLESRPRSGD